MNFEEFQSIDRRLSHLTRFTCKITGQSILVVTSTIGSYSAVTDKSGTWGKLYADGGMLEVIETQEEFLDEYYRSLAMIRLFEMEND